MALANNPYDVVPLEAEIGSVVRVLRDTSRHSNAQWLVGKIGIVVCETDTYYGELRLGVDFEVPGPSGSSVLHTLDRCLNRSTGRWYAKEDLEVVSQ